MNRSSESRSHENISAESSEINRVAVKPPSFWRNKPNLWFFQLEAQFDVTNITQDQTKYNIVLSALNEHILDFIEDILSNPPTENKNIALKSALTFNDSEEAKLKKFLGDCRPSNLLRQMKSLAGSKISEKFLKTLWFRDSLFRDLPYCFVYIDDIIIASLNLDEHISHLKEIFQRLTENGLVLDISKCIFAKPEVDFLGHHVSASGIRPTTERIQAILDFNRPSTVKQLRRFLGMLNFYLRFLPNAAKHQTKLNDFLVGIKEKKNKSIDWDEDSIKAFKYCKEQLSESTTLAHPVSNAHLAIMVDASDNAVGGVMQQYVSNQGRIYVWA
ncbi:hypothetical protein TNCT_157351 [Trichonephila clavata]|uniref:RNA-directed DNA polymerase n=1 Tax=Trichonephila clavata TaxID=2740835 RepID=A0A8X6G6J9_TRICU|nr:hypothetical protein TNCT_157351 [Trichonephila clavata]